MRNIRFSILPFVITALLLASCRSEVSAAQGSATASPPSGTAGLASAPSFDEPGFSLRFISAEPYAVGKTGALRIELKAKAPYHVNQEYPHKFKLKPSDAVEFPNQNFGRDSMTVEQMSVGLNVPLKPTRVGMAKLEGEFAFSLCTADRCLIEKRTLATEIRVQ